MIQISTPIEAVCSNDNVRESSHVGELQSEGDSNAVWEAQDKKGKHGIFARLLEGLISKTKIEAAASNSGEDEALDLQNAGKTEKNNLKPANTKGLFDLLNNGEEEAVELVSGAEAAFFVQDGLLTAQVLKVKTGQNDLNSESKREELPQTRVSSDSAVNLKDETAVLLAGKADDGRDSAQNRGEASAWLPGRDKPRGSGNPESVNVSFRDMDAKFSQAQALANQTNNSGGEKEGRLSEIRNRRGRSNLEIRDLRTGHEHFHAAPEAQKEQLFSAAGRPLNAEIEIPVNLNLSGGKGDGSIKPGGDISAGKAFEEALARELRSGLSSDIVRDATVILRNGGEGTIKLSLRPASLGDVKIRLEMTENKITGYIIVESSEALRAFERELPVLEKAFKDSGFSETSLEMSLAQDEQNFTPGGEQEEGDFQSVSSMVAASRYESETEWIGDPPIQGELVFSSSAGRTPVNLLV